MIPLHECVVGPSPKSIPFTEQPGWDDDRRVFQVNLNGLNAALARDDLRGVWMALNALQSNVVHLRERLP